MSSCELFNGTGVHHLPLLSEWPGLYIRCFVIIMDGLKGEVNLWQGLRFGVTTAEGLSARAFDGMWMGAGIFAVL